MPLFKSLTACCCLLLSYTAVVNGIVTKEDPTDAILDLSDAKFFVSLDKRGNCAGSIIAENFVVTAAHCVCKKKKGITAIDYLGDTHKAVAAYWDPDRKFDCVKDGFKDDVAILEFSENTFTSHEPRDVYSKNDEVDKTIWILGMGISGQPDDFTGEKNCYKKGKDDKKLRDGLNKIVKAQKGILQYTMNKNGKDREAIAQDGDSGGPALIEENGEWLVAGVNSGTNENNSCDWGSNDIYARLSEHAAWTERAMDNSLDDKTRGLWYDYRESTKAPTSSPAPTPLEKEQDCDGLNKSQCKKVKDDNGKRVCAFAPKKVKKCIGKKKQFNKICAPIKSYNACKNKKKNGKKICKPAMVDNPSPCAGTCYERKNCQG